MLQLTIKPNLKKFLEETKNKSLISASVLKKDGTTIPYGDDHIISIINIDISGNNGTIFWYNVGEDTEVEIRIGRGIGRLFTEDERKEFENSKTNWHWYKELEQFVNLYKAYIDKHNKLIKKEFRIVYGDDIIKWYCGDNYRKGNGQLNKSCMAFNNWDFGAEDYYEPTIPQRLKFYADKNFKDKIRMLILVDHEDKLLGRCILWKLDDPKGRIYADRIYTIYDYDYNTFEDYIDKKGWLKYYDDKPSYMEIILHTTNDYSGNGMMYAPRPYMDTFNLNYFDDDIYIFTYGYKNKKKKITKVRDFFKRETDVEQKFEKFNKNFY